MSIALDPASEQMGAQTQLGIASPMGVDADASVSQTYDVLQWAVGTGEPGHTFVLVDRAGKIAWIRDYGAPQNGGSMYVPVNEMVEQVDASLES